jgi:predicted tellurium resistance membrane protein TerC
MTLSKIYSTYYWVKLFVYMPKLYFSRYMRVDFTVFAHTSAWVSLLTLTFLEIVLGMDNIISISDRHAETPAERRKLGQNIGLLLAMMLRIILLFFLGWILGLKTNLLPPGWGFEMTGKGLILVAGGIFSACINLRQRYIISSQVMMMSFISAIARGAKLL